MRSSCFAWSCFAWSARRVRRSSVAGVRQVGAGQLADLGGDRLGASTGVMCPMPAARSAHAVRQRGGEPPGVHRSASAGPRCPPITAVGTLISRTPAVEVESGRAPAPGHPGRPRAGVHDPGARRRPAGRRARAHRGVLEDPPATGVTGPSGAREPRIMPGEPGPHAPGAHRHAPATRRPAVNCPCCTAARPRACSAKPGRPAAAISVIPPMECPASTAFSPGASVAASTASRSSASASVLWPAGPAGAAAVAALVVGDDPVVGGQVPYLRGPERGRAGPAVGEDDGRARPRGRAPRRAAGRRRPRRRSARARRPAGRRAAAADRFIGPARAASVA